MILDQFSSKNKSLKNIKVVDEKNPHMVDLKNIRVIPKIGGTVDDTELIDGLVLTQKTLQGSGLFKCVKL